MGRGSHGDGIDPRDAPVTVGMVIGPKRGRLIRYQLVVLEVNGSHVNERTYGTGVPKSVVEGTLHQYLQIYRFWCLAVHISREWQGQRSHVERRLALLFLAQANVRYVPHCSVPAVCVSCAWVFLSSQGRPLSIHRYMDMERDNDY